MSLGCIEKFGLDCFSFHLNFNLIYAVSKFPTPNLLTPDIDFPLDTDIQPALSLFFLASFAPAEQIIIPMPGTRPHKRQKASHAYQSVMLMTTLSLISQYSQADEVRPTKRRRTNEYIAPTHTLEERLVAEAMLSICS